MEEGKSVLKNSLLTLVIVIIVVIFTKSIIYTDLASYRAHFGGWGGQHGGTIAWITEAFCAVMLESWAITSPVFFLTRSQVSFLSAMIFDL